MDSSSDEGDTGYSAGNDDSIRYASGVKTTGSTQYQEKKAEDWRLQPVEGSE